MKYNLKHPLWVTKPEKAKEYFEAELRLIAQKIKRIDACDLRISLIALILGELRYDV